MNALSYYFKLNQILILVYVIKKLSQLIWCPLLVSYNQD